MNSELTQEQVIRGTIRRVTFHNPSNGYSVLQVSVSGKGDPLTVVGYSTRASIGTQVIVRGVYKEHPKYGKQMAANSITETQPSSPDGIEKYLASGMIKGIGQRTAERIVEAFGEETIEIICKEPGRVAKLPGVGRHKAALLKEALSQQADMQAIMRFLLEHNVTQGLATRIHEKYGNRAVEVLSKDPYLLAREMRGVGFQTADTIAMNLGLAPDAPQRLRAGLYYALERAGDDGHCFLPLAQLLQRAIVLLGIGDDAGVDLSHPLEALIEEGYILKNEENIYLRHLFKAEEFVTEFIFKRVSEPNTDPLDPSLVEESISQSEKILNLALSAEQQVAVHEAAKQRLLIITGGPGCGKTTLIRALTLLFKKAKKRLFLAAPTGRAAQRMSQVCDHGASTIHRLLRFDPVRRTFLHGINDPLPADALIVDEASMIDISLAKDLFSAVPREAALILVGDKDQLPSVGPGRVFGDLVANSGIKTISLSRLFRRKEESTITSVAHMINAGIVPQIPEPDGVTKSDAYFIFKKDPEEAARLIEKLVADQVPKKFGFDRHDICVLTPSNRGELGAEKLNARLQEALNPRSNSGSEQELLVGSNWLRLGDRVCQRVNNYQIDDFGVFNGDMGQIYSVDRRNQTLVVELWDGRLIKYTSSDLYQLSLAYAVTVHRSQGSEIPCVVLALHDSHYTLLERQLIYTAITRAKKLLIIVGSKRALAIASKRASASKRYTNLQSRLERLIAGR